MMNHANYLEIYDLENYLLETVRQRFHAQGYLSAFDFFCIVIWKANRAKSKIAQRLARRSDSGSLEDAVRELTSGIYRQPGAKDRLRYLFEEWSIWLPMGSAILTVLYPDEFTVYDYRVCGTLGDFHKLNNLSRFEDVWKGYLRYRDAVIQATPEGLSLRDRDRYLWGKSFSEQLTADISSCFNRERFDESE